MQQKKSYKKKWQSSDKTTLIFTHHTQQQQNHLQSLTNEEKNNKTNANTFLSEKTFTQQHIQQFTLNAENSTNKKVRTNQQNQLFIISNKKITKN